MCCPRGHRTASAPSPETPADFLFLSRGWFEVDKMRVPRPARALVRDSYDNCLAYLDERLGELFDELRRRGELDRTVVIVTADHGEGLGEHDLFDHGESLYRPEIRVPLLIALPSGGPSREVVSEPVSLRDVAATIVDLVSPGSRPTVSRAGSLTRLPEETADRPVKNRSMMRPSSPNLRLPTRGIPITADLRRGRGH